MLKFNCSSLVVARWLLVAAVWVFAALLSAPTAFAIGTWRYVSLTGNDSVKTGPTSTGQSSSPKAATSL
jgi:hypothetical protein